MRYCSLFSSTKNTSFSRMANCFSNLPDRSTVIVKAATGKPESFCLSILTCSLVSCDGEPMFKVSGVRVIYAIAALENR